MFISGKSNFSLSCVHIIKFYVCQIRVHHVYFRKIQGKVVMCTHTYEFVIIHVVLALIAWVFYDIV